MSALIPLVSPQKKLRRENEIMLPSPTAASAGTPRRPTMTVSMTPIMVYEKLVTTTGPAIRQMLR